MSIVKSNYEMQEIVIKEIYKNIEKWFDHCERAGLKLKDLELPVVKFDIQASRTNGILSYDWGLEDIDLRFNPETMKANFEAFLKQTVVHEVAHYCVLTLRGIQYSRGGRRISHGKDWKWMMSFFGLEAKRCNSYENKPQDTKTRAKRKTFMYKCDCQLHEITVIRHNKIVRGTGIYSCNKCRAVLKRA